jgi:hypothetical protein
MMRVLQGALITQGRNSERRAAARAQQKFDIQARHPQDLCIGS